MPQSPPSWVPPPSRRPARSPPRQSRCACKKIHGGAAVYEHIVSVWDRAQTMKLSSNVSHTRSSLPTLDAVETHPAQSDIRTDALGPCRKAPGTSPIPPLTTSTTPFLLPRKLKPSPILSTLCQRPLRPKMPSHSYVVPPYSPSNAAVAIGLV